MRPNGLEGHRHLLLAWQVPTVLGGTLFKDLVAETERCAQQSPQSQFKDEKEHCMKVFTL